MTRGILKNWQIGFAAIASAGYFATMGGAAVAQVLPDDMLAAGERSRVTGNPVFQINGGAVRGSNLFHSFRQFSLTNGQTASFNNAPDITNIITRVTGGTRSEIDGILRANGSANLFLINPSGIVFGPNAQLNLGGSFLATTADALQFGNQGFFSATNPEAPPLLTVNPSALWFNRVGASPIINRSTANGRAGLRLLPEKSLVLAGGDVRLEGGIIRAPGGRVELGGVHGLGTVELMVDGNQLQLGFPQNRELAQVSLAADALVIVRAGGGGSIAVNSRDFTMAGQDTFLVAGIAPGQGAPNARSGDVVINATESVNLDSSIIQNRIEPRGVGSSGDVVITTKSLILTRGAQINASTYGQGNAGNIFINAHDRLVLDGFNPVRTRLGSAIFSSTGDGSRTIRDQAIGNGGNIYITTGSLSILNGAGLTVTTDAQGNAGNIFVNARENILIDGISNVRLPVNSGLDSFVGNFAVGNGGTISLVARSLKVSNGASINANSLGRGNAGNITISVQDAIVFDGVNRGFISAIFTNVSTPSVRVVVGEDTPAIGGDIVINARTISLTNGAQLFAGIRNRPGRAGNIRITAADTVNLAGTAQGEGSSGFFTITEASQKPTSGTGGAITVTTNTLRIADGAVISGRSTSDGAGGNIALQVNMLELLNGGQVITAALQRGKAGNIFVEAADGVTIAGSAANYESRALQFGRNAVDPVSASSGLFANTRAGSTGRGGNIAIQAGQLRVDTGGQIAVNSQGSGEAGNLTVTARTIQLNDRARLTAETGSTQGGNITLNLRDLLLLRRNSVISTTAGTAQTGGDGGNITIDAGSTGFVVADLSENSDIRANAFTGKGGNVLIDAQGIYGIQFQPKDTPFSDITASSELGVSGTVAIVTPDLDPSRGTIALPTGLVDTDALVANSCIARRRDRQGNFVVTGAGGLPTSPDDLATSPLPTYELVPPESSAAASEIVEIDGIYRLPSGEPLLGRQCR